jgi:hypothetical protein
VLLTSPLSFQKVLTPPQYPVTHFPQPGWNPNCSLHGLQLQVCPRASYIVSLLPRHSPHLLFHPLMLFLLSCQIIYPYIPCAVQEWHSGSTVLRQQPTPAGTHHHPGSDSSALHGTLEPDTSSHIGPLIHFTILATPGKPV